MPGQGAILIHIDSLDSHTITDEQKLIFYKILAVAMSVPVDRIKANLTFFKVRLRCTPYVEECKLPSTRAVH